MLAAGMATAVMDEVLRQKDPDLKEAVAHAREGEARSGSLGGRDPHYCPPPQIRTWSLNHPAPASGD